MRIGFASHDKKIPRHLSGAMIVACAVAFGVGLAIERWSQPPPVHASSRQAQEAGAAIFRDKGCQHCHGADATGTDRGPDLSTVGRKWHPDHIEQQIRVGGGGMPPFGDVLQDDEIRSLVAYLSAKRKPLRRGAGSGARMPGDPTAPPAVKPPADDSGRK